MSHKRVMRNGEKNEKSKHKENENKTCPFVTSRLRSSCLVLLLGKGKLES
jgi:hypothetical protein